MNVNAQAQAVPVPAEIRHHRLIDLLREDEIVIRFHPPAAIRVRYAVETTVLRDQKRPAINSAS